MSDDDRDLDIDSDEEGFGGSGGGGGGQDKRAHHNALVLFVSHIENLYKQLPLIYRREREGTISRTASLD